MSPTHEPNGPEKIDRRKFLMLAGAATIAGALPAVATSFAQAPSPPPAIRAAAPDTTHAAAAADTLHAAKAPEGPSEDAKALAGILRRRFPDRLSEEQWAAVTRGLDGRLASGRALKEAKLANGDEPDFTFRA